MLMPGAVVRASAQMPEVDSGLVVPRVEDARVSDSNTIYLTFDDGYIGIAEKVAALNALGVPGTFFLTGQGVAAHPADVQWLVNSGHVLGNHTYDHQDLTKLSSSGIARELQQCESIALNTVGVSTQPLMRPTYGSVNATLRQVAANLGYQSILWNWDTRDWAGSSASYIESNFGTGIVLMHTQGRNTVAALYDVIPSLASQGYTFALL
jgi:peptidoglycan/xylan/chitin deacetylase (PgdA/CDA1 family)